MQFQTVAAFDMQAHIEILKKKEQTIRHFCGEVAILLAPLARNKSNVAVADALLDMLAFDTRQSIAICEEQERNKPSLSAQLVALTDQRDQVAAQIDNALKVINAQTKQQTGQENPALAEIILAPTRQQLLAIETEINTIQRELEKRESSRS